MFNLTIENEAGEQFQINNDVNFAVVGITGLAPPAASISTSVIPTMDGEQLGATRLNMRNIVITMNILQDVERNRIMLYRYFKVKHWCRIYYKNGTRNVYIEGYVETFEDDFFTMLQTVQISIVCPKPYFKDLAEIYFDISQVLALFEFPFQIEAAGIEFSRLETTLISKITNGGDVETGTVIEITASGQVVNPKIYNADTRRMFGINITMAVGDRITINTNKGEKAVTLYRAGKVQNIINHVMEDPEWFQLEVGENSFTYDCDSGNEFFTMRMTHVDLYEGV